MKPFEFRLIRFRGSNTLRISWIYKCTEILQINQEIRQKFHILIHNYHSLMDNSDESTVKLEFHWIIHNSTGLFVVFMLIRHFYGMIHLIQITLTKTNK